MQQRSACCLGCRWLRSQPVGSIRIRSARSTSGRTLTRLHRGIHHDQSSTRHSPLAVQTRCRGLRPNLERDSRGNYDQLGTSCSLVVWSVSWLAVLSFSLRCAVGACAGWHGLANFRHTTWSLRDFAKFSNLNTFPRQFSSVSALF